MRSIHKYLIFDTFSNCFPARWSCCCNKAAAECKRRKKRRKCLLAVEEWNAVSLLKCLNHGRYRRHETAFGDFSTFRKSSYFHIFICPSNKAIFLQEVILKHLLEPTRLSVVVNHWLFLTISLPLLGLEFLSELFSC